ncbi:MAG TPA: response regulator transcription factor [Usitatibacter sp.]|nr:response regulator transcription factor [Usitatibacter sp.]
MDATPVRVVVVDDHGLCRRGLAELLEHRAGIRVVGSTGEPEAAVRLVRELKPDLVIMDLRMPAMHGLALLRRIRDEGLETPAVVLTMCDSQEDLANAMRAGVRGYLLKDMDPEDVVDAIRRTLRGELVVAPAMANKLSQLFGAGPAKEPAGRSLTEREVEILGYIARGMSNKGIAKALAISHDTVKLHVRHILSKLNVSSRVEAAVYAVERKVSGSAG